jgi:hypothetical protein
MPRIGALAAAFVPKTFGGRITESRICVHPTGCDRLIIRNVIDSLYWRLSLRYAKVITDSGERVPAFRSGVQEFHSLVWEHLSGDRWRTRARLNAWKFRLRNVEWVHDVHSIDPDTGIAIIQTVRNEPMDRSELPQEVIAEAQKFGATLEELRAIRAQYTWVSWNIISNKQVAVLKPCSGPFERYDG